MSAKWESPGKAGSEILETGEWTKITDYGIRGKTGYHFYLSKLFKRKRINQSISVKILRF